MHDRPSDRRKLVSGKRICSYTAKFSRWPRSFNQEIATPVWRSGSAFLSYYVITKGKVRCSTHRGGMLFENPAFLGFLAFLSAFGGCFLSVSLVFLPAFCLPILLFSDLSILQSAGQKGYSESPETCRHQTHSLLQRTCTRFLRFRQWCQESDPPKQQLSTQVFLHIHQDSMS